MKTNSDKNRSKKGYRKCFIILPIVFLICGYMLFFVCLTPVIDPLLSAYGLAFSNTNAKTIDETGTNSIFNGSTGVHSGLLNYDDFEFPNYGSVFGNISVEGTEINCDLIYGDDTALLKKGACMSLYSHIPGCGKGVMIAAHNNTYFHTLPEAEEGSLVHIETNYGSYVYKVYRSEVIKENERAKYAEELNGDKEVLILYTCYPIDTLASTPYRYFVFCEFVSGPQVNMYE